MQSVTADSEQVMGNMVQGYQFSSGISSFVPLSPPQRWVEIPTGKLVSEPYRLCTCGHAHSLLPPKKTAFQSSGGALLRSKA